MKTKSRVDQCIQKGDQLLEMSRCRSAIPRANPYGSNFEILERHHQIANVVNKIEFIDNEIQDEIDKIERS